MAQVSMNLDDYTVTPPHVAYEACAEEARALKVAVAGSELVGLIPLRALLMAAEHYIAEGGPVHPRRAAEDPAGRRAAGALVDHALRPRQAHH